MKWTILLIGLTSQFFYTARAIVQWFESEKSKKIESPTLFWIFSIIGSTLFFIYGWMRDDFSIIFGELLSFYIYMWNLKIKDFYKYIPKIVPVIFALVPVVVVGFMLKDISHFSETFFKNENIPLFMVIWGSVGQFIYKMRFVYQWFYSVKRHDSLLPITFWYILIVGSLMIIVYGLYRLDWVLILGQLGIVAAIRNVVIGKRAEAQESSANTTGSKKD